MLTNTRGKQNSKVGMEFWDGQGKHQSVTFEPRPKMGRGTARAMTPRRKHSGFEEKGDVVGWSGMSKRGD